MAEMKTVGGRRRTVWIWSAVVALAGAVAAVAFVLVATSRIGQQSVPSRRSITASSGDNYRGLPREAGPMATPSQPANSRDLPAAGVAWTHDDRLAITV